MKHLNLYAPLFFAGILSTTSSGAELEGISTKVPASEETTLCVVDTGSRSTKMIIANIHGNKGFRRIFPSLSTPSSEYKMNINFGLDVEKGKTFSDATLMTYEQALTKMSRKCFEITGAKDNFYVFATAAARDTDEGSRNKLSQIAQNLGGRFEVLSKEKEAISGFVAASGGDTSATVMDFGSRSFQLAKMSSDGKINGVSFNLGHELTFEKFYKNQSYSHGAEQHRQALEQHRYEISGFKTGRTNMMGGSKLAAIVLKKNLAEVNQALANGPVTIQLKDIQDIITTLTAVSDSDFISYLRESEMALGIVETDRSKYVSGLVTLEFILRSQGRTSVDVVESDLADGYALSL